MSNDKIEKLEAEIEQLKISLHRAHDALKQLRYNDDWKDVDHVNDFLNQIIDRLDTYDYGLEN